MATFRKRSNAWQARIQRQGYPDVSKSFRTRSEAVQWARRVEAELDSGVFLGPSKVSKVSLRELLQRYMLEITVSKKHPEIERYRIKAWMANPMSELPMAEIKRSHIATWRDQRVKSGCSPNTIRLELSIISNLFNIAIGEWGYEDLVNPTMNVRLPRLPSGRSRRLDRREFELIAQNSSSEVLARIILLALETGMRRSEIARIEWRDVDLKKRTLHIPLTKSGEPREIPLSPKALELLESIRKDGTSTVFDISPHAITIAFGRACKRAGISGLHFHDLRHEAISRFFERGLSLPEVASISGHKTWTMLRRYTHLSAERLALKLE